MTHIRMILKHLCLSGMVGIIQSKITWFWGYILLPLLCSMSLISPNFAVKLIIFSQFWPRAFSQNCWKRPWLLCPGSVSIILCHDTLILQHTEMVQLVPVRAVVQSDTHFKTSEWKLGRKSASSPEYSHELSRNCLFTTTDLEGILADLLVNHLLNGRLHSHVRPESCWHQNKPVFFSEILYVPSTIFQL